MPAPMSMLLHHQREGGTSYPAPMPVAAVGAGPHDCLTRRVQAPRAAHEAQVLELDWPEHPVNFLWAHLACLELP